MNRKHRRRSLSWLPSSGMPYAALGRVVALACTSDHCRTLPARFVASVPSHPPQRSQHAVKTELMADRPLRSADDLICMGAMRLDGGLIRAPGLLQFNMPGRRSIGANPTQMRTDIDRMLHHMVQLTVHTSHRRAQCIPAPVLGSPCPRTSTRSSCRKPREGGEEASLHTTAATGRSAVRQRRQSRRCPLPRRETTWMHTPPSRASCRSSGGCCKSTRAQTARKWQRRQCKVQHRHHPCSAAGLCLPAAGTAARSSSRWPC